uniref:3-hydroxyacyl-CoA dehydrogenase (PaaH, hbd, fadB, mmgB) n=1 Tax=uncultured marine group II/III euryarchaeote KM3_80_G12 TaxID=1456515 RepID=A0A075HRE1_9EURY|nr:3-hydroxyacyl-CoA dehydrogenase (paaH, hbd, fadB, mmgB) [uncultured marine group II/III euryarchaeote KM3_80_G12]
MDSNEIGLISVIGAGQMGNGIAQVAAVAGFEVLLIDVKPEYLESGLSAIKSSLGKMVSKEKLSQADATQAEARIRTGLNLEAAVESDLVIEAIPEIPDLKFSTFSELDNLCAPHTILASNTSSISINAIAAHTERPANVIGMHFMNPVPLMKLVEIINGSATEASVTAAVIAAAERMGKTALCANDSPGFISNRLLCPMLNEAILSVQEGVAEPDAIDGIMKLGLNHPIGPLALADLIGLDTVLHIMQVLHAGFNDDKYEPAALLKQMVDAGQLGRKSGSGFYNYS